jgi:hypothetical protein
MYIYVQIAILFGKLKKMYKIYKMLVIRIYNFILYLFFYNIKLKFFILKV